MASKLVKMLSEGSFADRVKANFLNGTGIAYLSESEEKRLKRAELALELLENNMGNTRVVVGIITGRDSFVSKADAYLAVADAKEIFGMVEEFDYFFSLLIQKQRIEKQIKTSMGNNELKIISSLEKNLTEVLDRMQEYKERIKPEEEKKIAWVLHTDLTALGINQDTYNQWKDELMNKIIPSVKRKYKGEIEDAEYTEI